MQSKEKLIKLFKQCCDDKNFAMDKKGVEYDKSVFPTFYAEGSNYILHPKTKEVLDSAGLAITDSQDILTPDNTRAYQFEFDEKPPLLLFKAKRRLTLMLDPKYLKYDPVELFVSKTRTDNRKITYKTWYGMERTKYVDMPSECFTRKITVDPAIESKIKKICGDPHKYYDEPRKREFPTVTLNSTIKSYTMVSESMDSTEMDDVFGEKSWNRFYFNDEVLKNNIELDKAYGGISGSDEGGILVFGEVWAWLNHEEKQELFKYYKDSIKTTHMQLLDHRLETTKQK